MYDMSDSQVTICNQKCKIAYFDTLKFYHDCEAWRNNTKEINNHISHLQCDFFCFTPPNL